MRSIACVVMDYWCLPSFSVSFFYLFCVIFVNKDVEGIFGQCFECMGGVIGIEFDLYHAFVGVYT
jgi:hypothetical protein